LNIIQDLGNKSGRISFWTSQNPYDCDLFKISSYALFAVME